MNELRFALNSAVHSPLRVSPAFLNLGRNPVPSTLLPNHSARQLRNYNKNRREVLYQVGDLLRRRNHVLSFAEDRFAAKQALRFVEPAKVVQVYSSVVYLVEDLDSKR